MKKFVIAVIPLLVLALVLGTVGCKKAATPTPTPVALFLSVTQPKDGSVVNTANVTVSGSTIPGAVVSVAVNDTVYIASVDARGDFSIAVPLDEGPNFIEVDASDDYGNQQSASIGIVYTP